MRCTLSSCARVRDGGRASKVSLAQGGWLLFKFALCVHVKTCESWPVTDTCVGTRPARAAAAAACAFGVCGIEL